MTLVDSIIAAGASTVLSTAVALRLTRTSRRVESADEAFGEARAVLATRRRDLQAQYAGLDPSWSVPEAAPLLTKPEWIAHELTRLADVQLVLEPDDDAYRKSYSAMIHQSLERNSDLWGRTHKGLKSSYSQTVRQIEQPDSDKFADGRSYRLLEVVAASPEESIKFKFGWGSYFDAFDTSEVIAYRRALADVKPPRLWTKVAYKLGANLDSYTDWLVSPDNLSKRCSAPGVNTLTIRRGPDGPRFYLHKRGGTATADGVLHVAPAGEFQPADESDERRDDDFRFESTIFREFVEEFLDEPTLAANGVHCTNLPAYSELTSALAEQTLQLYFLGFGYDPLSWKPEILTVAVFEDDAFRAAFPEGPVLRNREGTMMLGRDGRGFPFTEEACEQAYNMLPAGAACLRLAWAHREWFGLELPGGSIPRPALRYE